MAIGASSEIVIVGGGFSGLSAALELSARGLAVTVLEAEAEVGGLAGSFEVGGVKLEKFYHHWFTNDRHVMELIEELGLSDQVLLRTSNTGMYHANRSYRLSKPLDLLKFTPLGLIDRIRLGLLVFQARAVRDWMALETLTAEEWLISLCGRKVYSVVWEPLLKGKFGPVAGEISAVWFWNKLALRGGSRGKGGKEMLAYFRGGFAALAAALCRRIVAKGGTVLTGTRATGLVVDQDRVVAVETSRGRIPARAVILTTALPEAAGLMAPHLPAATLERLQAIRYLANVCLVLDLKRSLSETYWLNVNDPSFPFVGVIEHTNFEPTESYGGRHIVYLSRYLPESDALYQMDDAALCDYALPFLQRMFPEFRRDWINRATVWRARYAQPVVERGYSRLIPPSSGLPGTPGNVFFCSMAQIYPEDRGTNYAIRNGRAIGREVAGALAAGPGPAAT